MRPESMVDKFLDYFDEFEEGTDEFNFAYSRWCLIRMQAWFRMLLVRKEYVLQRFSMYHVAAMQIQFLWRRYCQSKMYNVQLEGPHPAHDAIVKIQSAWRRCQNRRIYQYYRELINFRLQGDPALLLKCINPLEAHLLERASGCHIRFRLGGAIFPPQVYYKVFTSQSICDLGAFAPRDYTRVRKKDKVRLGREEELLPMGIRVGTAVFSATSLVGEEEFDGWYEREENNFWRPINMKLMRQAEEEEAEKVENRKQFHYSKMKRKQDLVKRRKERKRQWLIKMHKEGFAAERGHSKHAEPVNLEGEDWEKEAEELLSWSENLDFEKYLSNWAEVATSAKQGVGSDWA